MNWLVVRVVKNASASAGEIRDLGSIPWSRRSPGEGNGNPLQYSCLENPVDRGATVHGVTKSRTRLKQPGVSMSLRGEHKMVQPLWKAVWHFHKRLNMELYDPGIPLLGITLWIWKHIYLYASVHSSIIQNSQKVETTQMFINWWMEKENVIYLIII